jgi:hypothetical protein
LISSMIRPFCPVILVRVQNIFSSLISYYHCLQLNLQQITLHTAHCTPWCKTNGLSDLDSRDTGRSHQRDISNELLRNPGIESSHTTHRENIVGWFLGNNITFILQQSHETPISSRNHDIEHSIDHSRLTFNRRKCRRAFVRQAGQWSRIWLVKILKEMCNNRSMLLL